MNSKVNSYSEKAINPAINYSFSLKIDRKLHIDN